MKKGGSRTRHDSKNRSLYIPTNKPVSETFSHPEFYEYYKELLIDNNLKRSSFNIMIESMSAQPPQCFRITAESPVKDQLKKELQDFIPFLKKLKVKGYIFDCLEDKFGVIAKIFFFPALMKRRQSLEEYYEWFNFNQQHGLLVKFELSKLLPFVFGDVKPSDSILSMAKNNPRIIEMVDEFLDDGFIVVNEPDAKKAKSDFAFGSSNMMVVSYPIDNIPKIQQFDKVICMVPSSDDGALRNKPGIQSLWSANHSVDNHESQKRHLIRALEFTKVGGLCIYSTNSINPFEDEAVVNSVLKNYKNKFEIVDCSNMYKLIKRKKGLTNWNINHISKREYSTLTSIDCKELVDNIDRCMRFYPHQINCTGTFIAVIKKLDEIEETTFEETTVEDHPQNETGKWRKNKKGHKNDQIDETKWYSHLTTIPDEVVNKFINDFGLPEDVKNLSFILSKSGELNIAFHVTPRLFNILTENNLQTLHICHAGARCFSYTSNYADEPSIPNVSTLPVSARCPTKRMITITLDQFREMSESCQINVSRLSKDNQNQLSKTSTGGIFIAIEGLGVYLGGLWKSPFVRLNTKKGTVGALLRTAEAILLPKEEEANPNEDNQGQTNENEDEAIDEEEEEEANEKE